MAAGDGNRRAGGVAIVNDLQALQRRQAVEKKLRELELRGGVAAKRGRANWKAPNTGGGIASPLTEVETAEGSGVSLREYHEGTTVFYSTDYLMAVELKPLKELHMTDANGDAVRLKFQKPKAGDA